MHLEKTPYDLATGRIVFRERTPGRLARRNGATLSENKQARPRPRIEDPMHNSNGSGCGFPMTKIFTDDSSDLRASAEHDGKGQLAAEDLRLLVAAMVD